MSAYWVILFTNYTEGDASICHSWVAIVDLSTTPPSLLAVGFRPKTRVSPRDPVAPGTISDESTTAYTMARAYPISKEEYDKIRAYLLEQRSRTNLQYDLFNHNCSDWAVDAVAIGLRPGWTKPVGVPDASDGTFNQGRPSLKPRDIWRHLPHDRFPKSTHFAR